MRLATFTHPRAAGPRVGALLPGSESLIDLVCAAAQCGQAAPAFATMLDFLDTGPAARDAAERVCEFASSQRPPDAPG